MQGDDLHIEKKIDANWYEGFHGDVKGIFPVAYVQIAEGTLIITVVIAVVIIPFFISIGSQ